MSELLEGAAPPNGEAESSRCEKAAEPSSRADGLVTNMGALLAAAGVLVPPSASDDAVALAADESGTADRKAMTAAPRRRASSQERERPVAPRLRNVPALGASPTALQDLFLNAIRRDAVDCTLHFTDGSQERGRVLAFDTFTLLLENHAAQRVQMIYKHSVARIVPARAPSALFDRSGEQRPHKDPAPKPDLPEA